ncbi:MAG: hypothetical protein DI598_15060 [Pseudopedobacter saltans]|uniref:GLPGLI family protein n=1 Tax=Pseudopedobacter saltans TaxID=151895 RepID=A0A2W5GPJ3_9SPHI|nr:MAG: hypothetical protein DI598_15060 [Pseudopedobacter saltans]
MRFFLFLLAFLGAVETQAQFGYTPSMNIQTPRGNVTIPGSYHYAPVFYGSQGIALKKYDYTIILKNDSTITGKGKIKVKKGISSLTIKTANGENRTYTPSETKEIFTVSLYGQKISGTPYFSDSCWLFKTRGGKISQYAIAPEIGTDYYSAIQKGDGRIFPLTKEHLISLVNENPEALKKAEKGKLDKSIEIYNEH